MTAGQYFVAFDVDAIKDYVFAAVRPMDITGASRLVEAFTQEAAGLSGVVYAGGGNGVLLARSADEAAALRQRLEMGFFRLTGGAGSCTAVMVPGGNFEVARGRLWRDMARRKAMRSLDEVSRVLVGGGVRPCQACGREPGEIKSQVGDDPADEELIGPQCELRRSAGRATRSASTAGELPPAQHISQLFGHSEDQEADREHGRGEALAAIYLDADRAGERLQGLASISELKAFAESVRSVTRAALYGAIGALRLAGRFLAPVVGGDDVLVFVDARCADAMLGELWTRLRPLERQWGLCFSGAVTVGPSRAPLRLLLRQVEADLRLAKQSSGGPEAGRREPAVVVTSLLAGRLHDPRQPLFGGPVGRSWWTGSPSVAELVGALRSVTPAQRAGMAQDLAQPSAELVDLDLEYRATPKGGGQAKQQAEAVKQALAAARRLTVALQERVPTVSLVEILRSGLLATEWWQ
jgi:hypothetical protein